jgi:hypothetical protein
MVSFNFYWKAVPEPQDVPRGDLETRLKYFMAPRMWGHDGTLRGDTVLDGGDIAYLTGMLDALKEDQFMHKSLEDLINNIKEHGRVFIWIGDSDDY